MEILGIGPLEFLFILLIIFLVMGPEDMQKTARTLGRWLRRLMTSETWRNLTHASQELRTLPNRLAREAGLEESLHDIQTIQRDIQLATKGLSRSLLESEIDRLYPGVPFVENSPPADAAAHAAGEAEAPAAAPPAHPAETPAETEKPGAEHA